MNKEDKIYLVVETFLKHPNLTIEELSLLPEIEKISKSSIGRYLNDPLVATLFGKDTYEEIKNILALKKLESRKKGGMKSFQNNQALKAPNGKFIGVKRAGDQDNIKRKIKHILIFTQILLEHPELSLQEIADYYNKTNNDKEKVTRDYVYDCLSEHTKYHIFSDEIATTIDEILVNRRIIGNKNGALKTNENRGR